MGRGQLRVVAVVWTIAALVDLAAVVAIIADGDRGWRLWLALVLFLLFTAQATAYWVLWTRKRRAEPEVDAGHRG